MIRSAKISKFSYRPNVGRSDAPIIALGALALLSDDDRGASYLVMLARPELRPAERAQMDWAAQKILVSPFSFLRNELDAALQERVADDVFMRLAQKFTWSIYASPATQVAVGAELAKDLGRALELLMRPTTRVGVGPAPIDVDKMIKADLARAALIQIAGPEFRDRAVSAYMPPAWMPSTSSPRPMVAG